MNDQQSMNGRLRRLGKLSLAAAAGISMISAAVVFRGELQNTETTIQPHTLLLAAVLTLAYRVLNAVNWGLVLRAISAELGSWQAARIWLTSEACRWLPGSFWSYGSRGVQATNAGIPGPLATLSLPLELLLTIVAWTMTAAVFLCPHTKSLTSVVPATTPSQAASIGIVAVVALLVAAWLGVRLVRKVRPQITKRCRHLRDARIVKRHVLLAGLNYFVLCGVNGLALYVVLQSLQPAQSIPVSAVVGANAAAWLIGFFAFMAPGGLVVREGALATILACWLPLEISVAAAVLWRVLQLCVEMFCLAVVLLMRMAAATRSRPAACRIVTRHSKPDLKTSVELL